MNKDLLKAIQKINKDHGKELVKVGAGYIESSKIPFSSPRVNYMLYGGVPRGKATELFGAESGGKTTSAIDIAKNAQLIAREEYETKVNDLRQRIEELEGKDTKQAKKDLLKLNAELKEVEENGEQKVVYVDAENTLDKDWAEKNGLDTDNLLLVRPDDETAEQVLQMILDLIDSGGIIALFLDSLPMLVSKSLYEETLDKKSYGGIAGVVSEFCRKVSGRIARTNTALIIINQARENLENPYDKFKTPGGRALKHLFALRLFFQKGKFFDENYKELPNRAETPAGNLVDVTIVKTKVSKPDRRVGYYTLNYASGIDFVADTLDLAVLYGFIHKAGAWYTFMNPETGEILQDINDEDLKFQGRASVIEYLNDDEEMYQELYDAIMKEMEGEAS